MRERYVLGRHPHINILDTVFVETTGGDLTVKIENNTETGLGIYAEPVDDKNQALADAEISYADLASLILLSIKPYRENATRFLVYNKRLKHGCAHQRNRRLLRGTAGRSRHRVLAVITSNRVISGISKTWDTISAATG